MTAEQKKRSRAFIDQNLRRLISRKFMVFLIATVAFWRGEFSQENWLIVSTIYIGLEASIDIVQLARSLKSGADSAAHSDVGYKQNMKP